MSTKITDIYLRYLNGEASRVELDVLFLYFEQATAKELQSLIDLGFQQTISTTADSTIDESLNTVHRRLISYSGKAKRHIFLQKIVKYAIAASVLLIAGLAYFLVRQEITPEDRRVPIAKLFIKNGNDVLVKIGSEDDSLWTNGQVSYQLIDSQTLRLSTISEQTKPIEQTLYTAQADFLLILEDGSTIKLNAHSTLKLQVPFGKKERKVELQGEGFFDIAHETARPFKVYASNNLIEVLGTQFSIRNYPEEKDVTTALLRGKIALSQQGKDDRIILSPGQKAISNESGIHILSSGTKQATAWKDRFFTYEDQPLQTVLMDLARWYNVVVDEHSIPANKRIYMRINKEQNLSKVLKLMGATSSMQFSLQDGKIMTDTSVVEKLIEEEIQK